MPEEDSCHIVTEEEEKEKQLPEESRGNKIHVY